MQVGRSLAAVQPGLVGHSTRGREQPDGLHVRPEASGRRPRQPPGVIVAARPYGSGCARDSHQHQRTGRLESAHRPRQRAAERPGEAKASLLLVRQQQASHYCVVHSRGGERWQAGWAGIRPDPPERSKREHGRARAAERAPRRGAARAAARQDEVEQVWDDRHVAQRDTRSAPAGGSGRGCGPAGALWTATCSSATRVLGGAPATLATARPQAVPLRPPRRARRASATRGSGSAPFRAPRQRATRPSASSAAAGDQPRAAQHKGRDPPRSGRRGSAQPDRRRAARRQVTSRGPAQHKGRDRPRSGRPGRAQPDRRRASAAAGDQPRASATRGSGSAPFRTPRQGATRPSASGEQRRAAASSGEQRRTRAAGRQPTAGAASARVGGRGAGGQRGETAPDGAVEVRSGRGLDRDHHAVR